MAIFLAGFWSMADNFPYEFKRVGPKSLNFKRVGPKPKLVDILAQAVR